VASGRLSPRDGAEDVMQKVCVRQGTLAGLHIAHPPGQGHFGLSGPLGQSGQVGLHGSCPQSFGPSAVAGMHSGCCVQWQQEVRALVSDVFSGDEWRGSEHDTCPTAVGCTASQVAIAVPPCELAARNATRLTHAISRSHLLRIYCEDLTTKQVCKGSETTLQL
jgi:hypothetical protein